jgi:UDP-N-acetylglucosamine diphosphorylase / glucose-1-phosphate thymidylyltransferase / UDP-N-acetylgalactosamine diphosphorylase / glucosamine-1-phosphate N-acetyltransferase / galactosamine-1-phosphate N-acetyltransferase
MKTAIILAAGYGKKIWPYNVTRNKAVLPIANQPLIVWQVKELRQAGIQNIVMVVDYRKEQLVGLFHGDSAIRFVTHPGTSGTAAAVLAALTGLDDENVLVCYGDTLLTAADISAVLERHQQDHALATALLNPLAEEKPNEWLCVQPQGTKIEYVLGHPRDSASHRFAGLFALHAGFRTYLLANPGRMESIQVGMMAPDESQLEFSLQLAIDQGLEIAAVETKGPFIDLDKPWHLLQANYLWGKHLCANLKTNIVPKTSRISEKAFINGHVVLGENSEIGDGVIIEGNVIIGSDTRVVQGAILEKDVIIGSHTTVRRYAQVEEGSCIGDRCFIGHCSEVAGVMMRLSYAYHYGEYWGILGESCDLGAATVCGNLRFDDGQTVHNQRGHREVPLVGANAAYLGDYVRTGVNVILMPGVKIGPYSVIGGGTMVSEDVADRTLLYVKQEHVRKNWGPEKYGW